ncbi:hypothetical protein F5Y10DRAFT_260778 [Nemania abortiva]|nr:hypothetical protein F5Y10DRAFT_260778 [Nemania abortiva]
MPSKTVSKASAASGRQPEASMSPRLTTPPLTQRTDDVQSRQTSPRLRHSQGSVSSPATPRRRSPKTHSRRRRASPLAEPRRRSARIQRHQNDVNKNDIAKSPPAQVQQSRYQQGSSTDSRSQFQQSQGRATSPTISGAESIEHAPLIMKITMGGELYSIFDHKTRELLYHAHRDADRGYSISYDGKICTAIHDSAGNLVYPNRPRGGDC